MLYQIGTCHALRLLPETLPPDVRTEVSHCVTCLDNAYGAERDHRQSGGCCLIVETADDLDEARSIIDYDNHPCEWAEQVGSEYLSALFVLNNDYTITLFLPRELAPKTLLSELEELQ